MIKFDEVPVDGQKFRSGPINISTSALYALNEGCKHAPVSLIRAHLTLFKTASMDDEQDELNHNAVAGYGNTVVTLARIAGRHLFHVCTRAIHSNPETYINLMQEGNNA